MDVYLVDGVRSPIGRFGGALAGLRATELETIVTCALLDRSGVPRAAVQRVVAGMVLQDMTESNPARIVGQRVGVPSSTSAFTVNMQCNSGMVALILAAQQVALGQADCALALSLESMSNSPYLLAGARWGCASGMPPSSTHSRSASSRVRSCGVIRGRMDDYAVVTHRPAVDAIDSGRFFDEIVPVEVVTSGGPRVVEVDEHPRRDIRLEALARLPPVRAGGAVTAGNAAGHNDAAAAALLCIGQALARLGVEPLARIPLSGTTMVGSDPQLMGYSAVLAAEAALGGADLTLDSIDLIECNEGFAVQLMCSAGLSRGRVRLSTTAERQRSNRDSTR